MKISNSGLLAAVALLVVLGPLCEAGAQNVAPAPPPTTDVRIGPFRFKKTVHDFGRIRDDKPVDGKFEFTNETDIPVMITGVTSSCGCTIVKWDKAPIGPGKSGEVQVHFDPAHRQGPEDKPVWIETDEPGKPKYAVNVRVDVIARIAIDPRALWIGELKRGETYKGKLVITTMIKDFQIKTAGSKDTRFQIKSLGSEPAVVDGEAGTRETFEVTFAGDKEVSIVNSQAEFETNDAKSPRLLVPLVGRVVGDLRIAPDVVNLRLEKAGEPFKHEIFLSSRSSTPFKVLDAVVVGREDMKLEIVPMPADPRAPTMLKYELRGVTPALTAMTGNTFTGTITFKTDIPDQPQATVAINGFVVLPSIPPAAPPAVGAAPAAPATNGVKALQPAAERAGTLQPVENR